MSEVRYFMRRFVPSEFSFSPLMALVPGFTLLAAFSADDQFSTHEIWLSVIVIGAGAVWAGFKQARVFPEPVTKVDTTLASVILDALPDPVLLLDKHRRVVAANRAADELLGSAIHGRDICLVMRQPHIQDTLKNTVAGHQSSGAKDVEFELPVRRSYQLQIMSVPKGQALAVRAVMALHEVTALKHAETMRADFVANASHELRSPLASVSGFIETLQTSAEDDPQARQRFLGIMDGEARRMARLIDDLLSLSKIEIREHIRPKEKVALPKILEAVVDSIQIRADKKNISLVLTCPHDFPEVYGDEDQLREVFQNLVDNAVKYGASDSPVNLKAALVNNMQDTGEPGVEVSVTNQGEGIAPEHLSRLTERFYRIDKSRSRAMGGTGLGLAIVKHIINRHRGRLIVTSELSQGATFSVQLPLEKSQHPQKA
ncbi:ATP-binding protein [Magnetovibrio sp. PR-2]|uniref:ATP-binding protein n=1 Tax=Magnetovibrio sp. PR-2 TaxID=3120356 RepID=UPI002FCDF0C9